MLTNITCPYCDGKGEVMDDEVYFYYDEVLMQKCPICKDKKVLTEVEYIRQYGRYGLSLGDVESCRTLVGER